MATSRPATSLFILIVGVGLWTDIHSLMRGAAILEASLFLASGALLIVGLTAFFINRLGLTKWAVIGGMGLLVLASLTV